MDWSGCVLVENNPLKLSGAPIVRGTRVQADAIVGNYRDGLSVDEISYQFGVAADQIRELLSFATRVQAVAAKQ